ncbi:MAG TPA: isochorismate synthase [Bacillota bacterium]|nr:isochorismate synthase [Bacillota bacterium]
MIETKDGRLQSLIGKAMRQLTSHDNNRQLVSMTKKIKSQDPLHFFLAAKQLNMDRTFWTSSTEDFFLVGVGSVYEIVADDNRYEQTKSKWYALLEQAEIHNPYRVPGTGLIALGGMSFDPKKATSHLWEKYKHSLFRIPQFVLTKYKAQDYLTININIHKDDDPLQIAHQLTKQEQLLLQSSQFTSEVQAHIIDSEEIALNQWKDVVQQAIDELQGGQMQKIVLARELRLKLSQQANIAHILKQLLDTQPNSYVFAFEQGDDCFVGATPERLVKLEKNHLLSTGLAGTAPRGETEKEDRMIGNRLLHDEKNLQEHAYVVQMIRDGIEKYCTDIDIPDEPVLYPLKNLQHLYTPVQATLKPGASIFDIIARLHPTPALGGTPTEEALRFIRDYELLDRGWYGAPIGWLDSNDHGEFAVAIRSGLIQGDEASLFAGCGILKDSDVETEYEETNIKFLPMLTVLGGL